MFSFDQAQFLKNKWVVFVLLFIILLPLFILILSVQKRAPQNIFPVPVSPSPLPQKSLLKQSPTPPQKKFKVIDTFPKNNQENVYPGEIDISFTTDVDIVSANSFILEINPPLPYYWKLDKNSYPTKQIKANVYGGLKTNTQYFLTIRDAKGGIVFYSWVFRTSSTPAESSSRLSREEEKKLHPLLDYTPYYSDDFNLGYSGDLTLKVIVKNPNIERVKQEVLDWIKSHGVDPSTHTIIYVNRF